MKQMSKKYEKGSLYFSSTFFLLQSTTELVEDHDGLAYGIQCGSGSSMSTFLLLYYIFYMMMWLFEVCFGRTLFAHKQALVLTN